MSDRWRIILDFDGTLTAEEDQAEALAKLSLATLATDVLQVSLTELEGAYQTIRAKLLAHPQDYWWEVNGLVASYCDEGAFILNTTTLQTMLREEPAYLALVDRAFLHTEYDPVADCTNWLFHHHTAQLTPTFRPGARELLQDLQDDPQREPVILTNSLGDKVGRYLGLLMLQEPLRILGDTRQYEMGPAWQQRFEHPTQGSIQRWALEDGRSIDLRRPAYFLALEAERQRGARLAVVADTLSLPGALPMIMHIPFFLLRSSYTPAWCLDVVQQHPYGHVLERLLDLPPALDALAHGQA